MDIGLARLVHQRIAGSLFAQPAEVVAWLGAMQAQDYLGTLWSIGLRLPESSERVTEQTIVQALATRAIVRTWPLRGTIHIVAAQDVRWLLALLTPRMIAQSAGRYRQLGLDEPLFAQSKRVFAQALQGGKSLTRDELYQWLNQAGIDPAGQRGYHLLVRAAQDGLICFGAPSGNQQTFALLDEWILPTQPLARDEALAELARRYFTSHGPATVKDLARWAGITLTDAKRGLAGSRTALTQETVAAQEYWLPHSAPDRSIRPAAVYLLPGFDEYVLGYGDRSAVLDPAHAQRICPGGNGVFSPTIVMDGTISGTWKRLLKKGAVVLEWQPFHPFSAAQQEAIAHVAESYAAFLEMPLTISQTA